MWLHMFRRPLGEWGTENYGIVLAECDRGRALAILAQLRPEWAGRVYEYAVVELVDGLVITAVGYDRAYLDTASGVWGGSDGD
jgi:hypothetical protein